MNNILIVDDQSFFPTFLANDLSDKEYSIQSVNKADEVLLRIQEFKPNIVLLDLYLNGFEGWDLLRDIKRQDPRLPVIIVSAYDSFRHDPRAAQADGYVIKDMTTETLKLRIKELLSKNPWCKDS